jgi:hypothetical protein
MAGAVGGESADVGRSALAEAAQLITSRLGSDRRQRRKLARKRIETPENSGQAIRA